MLSLWQARRRCPPGFRLGEEVGRHDGLSMTDWSRAFDDPIPLPDDRELVTLRDAGECTSGAAADFDEARAR
jgi:hypothetical protein